mgnify:CR=1 FL=1
MLFRSDLRRTRIDGDRVTTTTWHGGTQHDEVETTPAGHHALRDGVGRLLVGDYRGNQRWTPDGWRPLTLPPQESWLFAWRPIPGVAGVFRRSRGAPDAVAHIVGDALVPLPGTIDAAPWDGDVALLTATGVERWSPAEDRRTPVPFAIPASPTVIARDGCGRLWVGGDSVVLEPDQVVTFPGIAGRTWTSAVGLEDGVALTDGYVIAELRRECSP